jgi:hypothetical protein
MGWDGNVKCEIWGDQEEKEKSRETTEKRIGKQKKKHQQAQRAKRNGNKK